MEVTSGGSVSRAAPAAPHSSSLSDIWPRDATLPPYGSFPYSGSEHCAYKPIGTLAMRHPIAPWRAWPDDPRVFVTKMDGGIAVTIPTPSGGRRTSWAMSTGISTDDALIREILSDMDWPLPPRG